MISISNYKLVYGMKILYFLLIILGFNLSAQNNKDLNVIVITTDGFRWQEVFNGLDSAIAKQKRFHHGDSAQIVSNYWAKKVEDRRAKLLPFFWKTIAEKGQLHGNRTKGSWVNVANPFWFSYPGYSELLTGQVDIDVNSNEYKPNPNTNFFEYLNGRPAYKGKVAAFGAWDAFDRILNEKRGGFPVVSGFDVVEDLNKDPQMKLISNMQKESFKVFGEVEAQDVFTHYQAITYLKSKKPKALYISYGETDEFAHEGHYGRYLNAAHQFDAWLAQIWDFVEKDPQYKDNTILLITTDHGRGDKVKSEWTSHGQKIQDSHEIWFALLGKNIENLGEISENEQIFQKDLIHLIAEKMNVKFKSVQVKP
jgi:hypothetical protein